MKSLTNRAYLLLATVLLAILGDWSGEARLAGLWRLPAALLLLGLAYEGWYAGRIGLALQVRTPTHWNLGRPRPCSSSCAPTRHAV